MEAVFTPPKAAPSLSGHPNDWGDTRLHGARESGLKPDTREQGLEKNLEALPVHSGYCQAAPLTPASWAWSQPAWVQACFYHFPAV